MIIGRVHLAGPYHARTACGRIALLDDGTRILETDLDPDQITCPSCVRKLPPPIPPLASRKSLTNARLVAIRKALLAAMESRDGDEDYRGALEWAMAETAKRLRQSTKRKASK